MACYEHDEEYNQAVAVANQARVAAYAEAEEVYGLALYEASAAYGAARRAHGCDPATVAIAAATETKPVGDG